MKKLVLLLSALVFAATLTSPATAQTVRGSITGAVVDPSGAMVPEAQLTLTEIQTNRQHETTSNIRGEFVFELLPPGRYRLTAAKSGFRTDTQEVVIGVNQHRRVECDLALLTVADKPVRVESTAQPLRTETGSLGALIENRQLTALPLDGRNFAELSLLVPGTAPSAQGSAASVRGNFALSVNGGREDANMFLLDGVYNGDPVLNGAGVVPPVDAIHEFEVLTNSYDATFGRNSGGQVNVVTKNGANQIHGTVYEFFRNAALDGRNHFAPANLSDPKYQRNQFGYALGGPIVADRTFFFTDYEGFIERQGLTRLTNVPTLAERSGDFTNSSLPTPVIPGFGPVPIIPPAFQHPVGAAIAALYPEPNRASTTANFVSSPTQRINRHQFDGRVDHRFNSRAEVSARYSFVDRDLFEPFATAQGSALVPGYGNDAPRRAQNFMLSETHVFTPNFLNELRFALNRVRADVTQENPAANLNAAVGLPVPANSRDFGLSQINVTGFATLGHEINSPTHALNNTWQILNHATWVHGRHTLKFGGDFRALRHSAFRDVQSRGFLNFTGDITAAMPGVPGNALADLLLGLPLVTGRAILDNPQNLRAESYNFFVNDAWRIRPNLTLTAGLRYELLSPPVDPADRANIYDPATGGLVQVGTGGVPRAGYRTDKNNFGPRIGVAWSPTALNSNTVLRAGFGVYFDQSPLAPGEGLYFSQPFFDFDLFFQFTGLPPLTLTDPFPATFPIFVPSSALTYQRDLRTPYVQHWSAGVQQTLGGTRVIELAYAGSKGTRLLGARDINQPAPAVVFPNLRPNPLFDDITAVESRASSTYNSLQVRFQQSLDFGLTVLSAYTWSKSIDDASGFFASSGDPNFPQDSNNVRAERGLSNFDTRHRYSLAFTYDVPKWSANWSDWIASGWQLNGVLSANTGRPFTVALLSTLDNSNTGRSVLGFGANDRPNIVGDPHLSNPSETMWFNTAAFAPSCLSSPAPCTPFGTFGNAGRNILEGPGYAAFNFSVLKDFKATERMRVQFRTEFFNLFNRANFNLPDNFLGSPTFGQVTSAGDPRHVQFGLKFLF